MISYILSGRLGNLFYEIISIFEYCEKFNIDFKNIKFPKTHPEYYENNIKIHFRLEPNIGKFLDSHSFRSISENIEMFENLKDYFIDGNDWYKYFIDNKCKIGLKEDLNLKYDNIFFKNTNLIQYKKQFVKLFINEKVYNQLKDKYDFSNSVAIHVRRGDLLALPENHIWRKQVYSKEQIQSIILSEYLLNKNMKLFVFSEDIPWCKKNINFDNVVFIEGNKPFEDIYLMSMCKKIIKNYSSFNHMAINIKNSLN